MNIQSDSTARSLVEGHAPLTMSSREIAELTGKRHDNVRADIEKMGRDLSLTFQEKAEASGGGRPARVFHLPKRECIILVSGYDVTMRAKIVDRWMELEGQIANEPRLAETMALSVLNDPAAMRGILLGYTEKVIELQKVNAELQPKADAHDRLVEAHGSVCRSTAAKNLGLPPLTLIRWMRMNGWTFRRTGDKDDLAYQSKIVAGLLEHKVTTGPRPDGTEWTGTQVRVTPKGMLALAKVFPKAVSEAA